MEYRVQRDLPVRSKLIVYRCYTLTIYQFIDSNMIFSAVLLNLLFTNGPQMALSVVTCDRLGQEGLESIEDFSDFKYD